MGTYKLQKGAMDEDYVKIKDTLNKYGLACYALGAHLPTMCRDSGQKT